MFGAKRITTAFYEIYAFVAAWISEALCSAAGTASRLLMAQGQSRSGPSREPRCCAF